MSRLDRYLLSQLLGLFGFFSLVLVAVYWINRAVGLFDQLIGDGQSALVFLEFSVLTLPNVIRLVLPISAFAATVYVVNRLMQESELVVVQAAGFSAFRLARPVLVFGMIVMGMMLVLMHVLVPASRTALANRSAEISQNVTARFLNDGQFMHPALGITLYIRQISQTGELNDLFLSDERSVTDRVTYTARRALLVRGEDAPKLIMFDGSAQTITRADRRISVTRFADFTLDLAGLVSVGGRSGRTLDELSTFDLLNPTEATLAEIGESRAAFLSEGNARFAMPLLAVAAPLVGFACLMLGGFSRFGLWRQMGGAVLLLICLQLINTWGAAASLQATTAAGLVYAAPLAGFVLAVGLLFLAQADRHIGPRFWQKAPA
ncbi:MAG: LPS export ABC transporter permease LptF [Pseudomonadota bacterium]